MKPCRAIHRNSVPGREEQRSSAMQKGFDPGSNSFATPFHFEVELRLKVPARAPTHGPVAQPGFQAGREVEHSTFNRVVAGSNPVRLIHLEEKMTKKDQLTHTLVPEHVKLSDKERQELLDKYHVTLRELPKIKKDDPAIRHLELKEGDLVQIQRVSPTAGSSVFYRGVIDE